MELYGSQPLRGPSNMSVVSDETYAPQADRQPETLLKVEDL